MSFRQCFALLLILLSTVSCSYFFKEQKENSNVYKLSLSEKAGVSCIKNNSRLLRDYFEGRGDDKEMVVELTKMKSCIYDAINLFVKHTKGAQKDVYSPQEIHDFLSAAFENYRFSLDFMEDAFLLKQSVLGGSPDVVSKSEVKKLPLFINFIYDSLADLAPYRRFLFLKEPNKDLAGFEIASQRLLKNIAGFENLPRKSSGDFDYEGAVRFMKYFFDDDVDLQKWSQTFELVDSLQALISVGKTGNLNIQKLPFVLNNLATFYLGYMEFHKYIKDEIVFKDMSTVFTFPGLILRLVKSPDVFTDLRMKALVSTQKKLLQGIRVSATAAPHGKIPLSYVSDFISTLSRIGSLGDWIQAKTLQQMVPPLFGRWLKQNECGDQCDLQSLTAENADVLEDFIEQWYERQTWINQSGRAYLAKYKSRNQFTSGLLRNRDSSRSANVDSFLKVLSQVSHAHWETTVVIGDSSLKYKDLVIFDKIYTLAHLFFRPFNKNSEKPQLVDYYLDEQQAQDFYNWLRPLALDLKLGDPRTRTSGKQAFTEINLFGSQSSDYDKMSFSEAIEYFEISISTGIRSENIMKNQFVDCRLPQIPKDVFGYERFDSLCYRPLFYKQSENLMLSSLPHLLSSFQTQDEDVYRTYLNYLEKAARQGLIVDEPFETDAFRMMGSISQYAESLFLRFDRDKNDKLSTDEIDAAFKHIVPGIRKILSTQVDPDTAKAIYSYLPQFEENLITYIFKNKTIPSFLTSTSNLSMKTDFYIFAKQVQWLPGFLKRVDASRNDVLLVISSLSGVARAGRIRKMGSAFEQYQVDFDKGIKDEYSPIIDELVKDVQCSDTVESELRQWLVANQDLYWKNITQIKIDDVGPDAISFDIKLNKKNISASGWQYSVTQKLVELLFKTPTLGPACTLPYMESVQRISRLQELEKCVTIANRAVGVRTSCQRRDPY